MPVNINSFEPLLVNSSQLKKLLSISSSTLYSLCKSGKLKPVSGLNKSRNHLFLYTDVLALINQKKK